MGDGTGAGTGGFDFRVDENNVLDLYHGAGTVEVNGTTALSTGTWYMATVTWNTTRKEVFVNGVSDGTNEADQTMTAGGSTLYLGMRGDINEGFDGVVDECGFWNRVLSSSEITALYNGGTGLGYSSGGAEYATSTTEYRHRIEDGRFIKYTFDNNIWTAYDKNGTRYLFGTTTQAQQFATTSTTTVSRWMLEEVRDTNDNYIKYEYSRDGNQIYPFRITYTGNGTTDGPFTIDFATSTRPDVLTSYKTAYPVKTNYRISQIAASINGSWVRKYALSYGYGVNTKRSLLSSVQETGRDDSAVELALPAMTFFYSSSTPGYTGHTNPQVYSGAHVVADIDGNGLPDLSVFNQDPYNALSRDIYENEYPTFTHTTTGTSTEYWSYNDSAPGGYRPGERGVRLFDVNGDGKADIIRAARNSNSTFSNTYEQGTGGFIWTGVSIATTTNPMFSYSPVSDTVYSTGFLGNVNGDGLVDYVQSLSSISNPTQPNGAYLHNASTTGWTVATTTYTPITTVPTSFASQLASQLIDINGDGLDDWVTSGSGSIEFCLNNGTSWDTSCVSEWNIATSSRHANGWDRGIRFFDVNGDALSDYVRSYTMPSYNTRSGVTDIEIGTYNYVYLNTGSGWATSTLQMPEYIFKGYVTPSLVWGGELENNEPVDWNGDGIPEHADETSTTTKPDILKQIVFPTSGSANVEYQYSSQLATNPNLAFPVLVVTAMGEGDNRGNFATTTYTYNNGDMYTSGDVLDRKFAGFETITENKGDTLVKSYYYQGNTASTTAGELTDSFPLIGKMYRKDVMASSTGAVFKKTFYNWNAFYQGNNGRYFTALATTTEQVFDGDSTHKDTAESFVYSTSTGNVLSDTHWGEVVGNGDGTFVDTGSDMATTTTLYAASSSVNMQVPYAASTTSQTGTKVKETRNYFDGLALGSVNSGNRTKQENWISGSSYASTTRSYNSYGLVTQERDPRYNLTTYAYDSYNLYPATTTNALSQDIGYLYDYATGKVRQTLDPNTRRTQTLFDPVGRVKEIKQPDLTTPTTLVTKSLFAYKDTWPGYVNETGYLNAATSTDTYQYTDGRGRTYQTRKTADNGNVVVQDFFYNKRSLLASSSLPYFGTGASSTEASSASNLFTNYLYDPLDQMTSVGTVVGTTTTSYNDWNSIVTDPRGKRKDFYKDAYGNLSQVAEHNSGTHATTTYAYDLNRQLTSITDAAANVRNFTYDGLGRRLTAQDLHVAADTTFGTSTYAYDDAGNLTQQIDAKLQTVNFTYDALNRPLTEDYTGAAGTEVQYAYDSGTDGIGRLSAATTSDSVTNYSHNPLGKVSREVRTLENAQYQTLFDYDRLGNIASTTYPDGSQVLNTYNTGNLLEKIDRGEPGGAVTNIVANFDYAPHGQIALQDMANGVKTYKAYDTGALYRLSDILTATTTVGVSTTTIQHLAYAYDATGNITRITNLASTTATTTLDYVYDDLNRLTSAASGTDGSGGFTGGIAASSTLRAGLVSYWKLDETSGVAYDATSTNALTNNNTVTYGAGKISNAANYASASSQYHSIADASQTGLDLGGACFSLSLWFNLTTWNTNDFDAIVSKYDLHERSYRLSLTKEGGSFYLFDICDSTGENCTSSTKSQTFSTGTWYHVVASFDAPNKTVTIYHNGNSLGSASTTYDGATADTSPFNLAANAYFGNYSNTKLDEVGIWNRALSASEVAGLYNSGSGLEYSSGGSGSATSTQTYTYDILGNLTNKSDVGSYVYGGTGYANPHAVTDLASTTYAYDNNGNVTSAGSKLFSWNYRDRLTQVATGTATTTYGYDYSNENVWKKTGTSATTTYPSKYFEIQGATSTSYIYLPDGTLAAMVIGTGSATSTFYTHADHLGGINLLTNASGTVTSTKEFYPYGSIRTNSGTDSTNKGFIGERLDDNGLQYLHARFYQADKGRFLSEEPIFQSLGDANQVKRLSGQSQQSYLSDPQQLNSYSYGRDNPVTLKDPNGQSSVGSWLSNPIGSAFFTTSLGTVAMAAQFDSRPATAELIWHSLSLNPSDIYAGNGSPLTEAIKSNELYQSSLQSALDVASAKGLNTIKNVQLPLRFTQGDAATAFGKIDININATRVQNGTWQVAAQGSDKYDFAYQNYNRPALSTVNNTAYLGQGAGTVSNFTTHINFTQNVTQSLLPRGTASSASIPWGNIVISSSSNRKN